MRLPAWHAHPDVWLLMGSIALGYVLSVRRHERATGEAIQRRKTRLFLLGVAALWIGADWPIHDLAERYLYLAHMVQHLLFSLVAAPLLLSGLTPWMLRKILRPRWFRALVRFLTRPVVALAFFNGVLLFTHWPEIVRLSVGSEPLHFGLHALIVVSALAMWWPVVSPLPEMPPLHPSGQCLYLFLQSLTPTIPA
ncbi:MAG: cytochrome c oxidase assembly protein [Actinobacteria bacterium]|nr:cytochrome c oxidase assembly protein [Actinomycetota bacterium]